MQRLIYRLNRKVKIALKITIELIQSDILNVIIVADLAEQFFHHEEHEVLYFFRVLGGNKAFRKRDCVRYRVGFYLLTMRSVYV